MSFFAGLTGDIWWGLDNPFKIIPPNIKFQLDNIIHNKKLINQQLMRSYGTIQNGSIIDFLFTRIKKMMEYYFYILS